MEIVLLIALVALMVGFVVRAAEARRAPVRVPVPVERRGVIRRR
ncbi:MAG TPA: hypothetical protein VF897_10745 [Roseiflexaceae bacterium]